MPCSEIFVFISRYWEDLAITPGQWAKQVELWQNREDHTIFQVAYWLSSSTLSLMVLTIISILTLIYRNTCLNHVSSPKITKEKQNNFQEMVNSFNNHELVINHSLFTWSHLSLAIMLCIMYTTLTPGKFQTICGYLCFLILIFNDLPYSRCSSNWWDFESPWK